LATARRTASQSRGGEDVFQPFLVEHVDRLAQRQQQMHQRGAGIFPVKRTRHANRNTARKGIAEKE
jgi:hypothetical protein